jgi:proteasome activator subunit 4
MESAFSLLTALVRNGDIANNAVAATALAPLLPAVLRLQRTGDPDFDNRAKRALGHVAAIALPPAALVPCTDALAVAARDERAGTPWHARCAALGTIPKVAFRHAFLLPSTVGDALIACVCAALADSRVEVRTAAAVTLAGLIQGPTGRKAAPSLRSSFLTSAAAKSAVATAKATKSSDVHERLGDVHARVLGLAACVLACPYDCPQWLPPLVVALAAYARCPLPLVRASVLSVFAEFKRTHADTWADTKMAFGEDAWDAAAHGLEMSPSYFC